MMGMRGQYDVKFRRKVLRALDAGRPITVVAKRYGVRYDTIRAWLKLREETGSLGERPHGGEQLRKLAPEQREVLKALRLADPVAPHEVLAERLREACGADVCRRTLGKELVKLGFQQVRPVQARRTGAETPTGKPGGYRSQPVKRRRSQYPSDLSDAQWELLAPLVPAPKTGGRPLKHDRRTIVDAILYVTRTGCQWRALPHDFPPWSTVYDLFRQWRDTGVWERANEVLRGRLRLQTGRRRLPSAAIIDSQSVKTTEKGGAGDTTAESA